MWTYNLHEALQRLGVKGANQPDVMREQVMLAMLVGDVSHLASPALAPMALLGGTDAGSVATRASFQVWSRGTGGCWIDQLQLGQDAAGYCSVVISTADPFAPAPLGTACVPQEMGPTPLQSIARIGRSAVVIGAAGVPRIGNIGDIPCMLSSVYVPRGSILTAQHATLNIDLRAMAIVRDVPVQPAIA
jgi:hypothetical protein